MSAEPTYARREVNVPASLSGEETRVSLPGAEKTEALADLVRSGEVGIAVVERARKDLEKEQAKISKTMAERITECIGLETIASVLPRYLVLHRRLKGCEEKPKLKTGEWKARGETGMIIWHQRRPEVGLVIAREGSSFTCKFGDFIDKLDYPQGVPGSEGDEANSGARTIASYSAENQIVYFTEIGNFGDE